MRGLVLYEQKLDVGSQNMSSPAEQSESAEHMAVQYGVVCCRSVTHSRDRHRLAFAHSSPSGTQSGSGTGQGSVLQVPFTPQSLGQSGSRFRSGHVAVHCPSAAQRQSMSGVAQPVAQRPSSPQFASSFVLIQSVTKLCT